MVFAPDNIAWNSFFEGACAGLDTACTACLGDCLPLAAHYRLAVVSASMRLSHRTCRAAPAGFKISQDKLTSDPELLGALLDYHIVPDRALNESQVGGRGGQPRGSAGRGRV